MLLDTTKKYVINLKRREDRKEHAIKEMQYIGWDNYTFFEAIDTNSYEGCGYSHMEIAKILLKSNEQYIIAMEDDFFFMPWAKKIINLINKKIQNGFNFDIIHFAPSIHRPLKSFDDLFASLHDCPPLNPEKDRGILGTTGFIYNRKVAEKIIKWDTNEIIENKCKHAAIDQFFDKVIYPQTKSYCPLYPLASQYNNFSNINNTFDNSHYIMMYQWNSHISKLPGTVFDFDFVKNQRELNSEIIIL